MVTTFVRALGSQQVLLQRIEITFCHLTVFVYMNAHLKSVNWILPPPPLPQKGLFESLKLFV